MIYDPRRAGATCDVCPLRGKRAVPPEGPVDPIAAIVGETPGRMEEIKGKPFVGPSGVALNELLWEASKLIGRSVTRSHCFMSNTILCRPETPGLEGARRYEFKSYLAWIRKTNAMAKRRAHETKTPYVPLADPRDCCRPRLLAELFWLDDMARRRGDPNGIVIVPAGGFALDAITGKKGILKHRGSVIPIDLRRGTA